MQRIFIMLILSTMIFLMSFGTATADELVQIYDSGVYTMKETLAKNNINLILIRQTPPLYDSIANYAYKFTDEIMVVFGANGNGYINDIQIIAKYSAKTNDYEEIIVTICKALGMTDDMAYFMIQYKDGINDGFPSAIINNRRIFVMEEDDTQNNIIICGILAQALD